MYFLKPFKIELIFFSFQAKSVVPFTFYATRWSLRINVCLKYIRKNENKIYIYLKIETCLFFSLFKILIHTACTWKCASHSQIKQLLQYLGLNSGFDSPKTDFFNCFKTKRFSNSDKTLYSPKVATVHNYLPLSSYTCSVSENSLKSEELNR